MPRVATMVLVMRLVRLSVKGKTTIFQPIHSRGITLADCIRARKRLDRAILAARTAVEQRIGELES